MSSNTDAPQFLSYNHTVPLLIILIPLLVFEMQPQFPTPVEHSLDAVSPDSEIRQLYPRDIFPNPQSVQLPWGKTTFWLLGPEGGPKVALIHGISIPAYSWHLLAPSLAKHGFRVLVYDLYGRGYTEALGDPNTPYDTTLYITQLALLLQHLKFEAADIIGYSMGGGIAAAFAATFPNLVKEKVVFVASSGLGEPRSYKFPPRESFPDNKIPIETLPSNFFAPFPRLQLEALPGYYRALTSSLISGPLRGLDSAFQTIANNPRIKCLIVHGNKDTTVPIICGERIKGIIGSAEFVTVDDAGHDFVFSQNGGFEQLEESVLGFLKD